MAQTRQCGSCTACCDGWLNAEVFGQKVTAGKPCRYSTCAGCGVYADRPQHPCRDFVCGWILWDSTLPDWMRPSECGAIVFLWFDWQGQKVINGVPVAEKIPERTLDWLKDHAQENRVQSPFRGKRALNPLPLLNNSPVHNTIHRTLKSTVWVFGDYEFNYRQ